MLSKLKEWAVCNASLIPASRGAAKSFARAWPGVYVMSHALKRGRGGVGGEKGGGRGEGGLVISVT